MRILLISLGSIGRRHLKNISALLPGSEIVALRLTDTAYPEASGPVHKYISSLDEADSFDPEIVIISSPAHVHIKIARHFLGKAKGIFIEKPLCVKADSELSTFTQEASKSPTFTMVGYVLRFHPLLVHLKNIIEQGTLGKIYHAHIQVGQYLPDWRPSCDYKAGVSAQAKLGGGALLELSHEIDYAVWLFGYPQSYWCKAAKLSDLEIDVEDFATITLQYGGKAPEKYVNIQLDFLQRTAQMTLQIVGELGTIKADLINEAAKLYRPAEKEAKDIEFTRSLDGNEIYVKQFDFFLSKSLSNYAVRFSGIHNAEYASVSSASRVMSIIDGLRVSNKNNKLISVESTE